MRPPKVSNIPERTGTSYKKSQFFFQNINDVFGQQTQKKLNLLMTQVKLSHNSNHVTIYFLISSSRCVV